MNKNCVDTWIPPIQTKYILKSTLHGLVITFW